MNILVITQNPNTSAFLRRYLVSAGHSTVCISGTTDAVHASEHRKPNLIIVEISIPERPMLETAGILLQNLSTRHIPLIVISDSPELEYELPNAYDFICRPLDMQRLREDIDFIAAEGGKSSPAGTGSLSREEHLLFHDFLIMHSGLHFERRNIKTLEHGLKSRMSILRIKSYSEYYRYLCKNRDKRQELQKLLQYLTVGETYFFRYNAHFSALGKLVLPEMIRSVNNKKLRLLSAGCSTGEEPYTMAMTIMETIPDWRSRDIRILATDINTRSLQHAREGVYSHWKIRVTEKRYLEKYFRVEGTNYIVKDEVKLLVDFTHLNLQSLDIGGHPLRPESFDVIFCRNVMIYFNKATINKVVEHFTRSLGPGGYLFLGHSETLAHIPTNFARQLHDGGYYYRKKLSLEHQTQRAPRIAPLSELPVLSGRIPAPPTSTLQHTNRESFSRYETAIAQMDRNIYAEAERLFGRVLASKTDHPTSLGDALFNMNCGNFDTALDQCNRALLANDLLPEAYFLRGLIYETLHREDDSIKEYGKAILLKMDFVMPHYRLGKLCCRIGQRKNGARHLRNCMRLLEKADPETIISFSGGITRENLLGQLHNEILSIPV